MMMNDNNNDKNNNNKIVNECLIPFFFYFWVVSSSEILAYLILMSSPLVLYTQNISIFDHDPTMRTESLFITWVDLHSLTPHSNWKASLSFVFCLIATLLCF